MSPSRTELYEAIDEALDLAERIEAPAALVALLEAAGDSLIASTRKLRDIAPSASKPSSNRARFA